MTQYEELMLHEMIKQTLILKRIEDGIDTTNDRLISIEIAVDSVESTCSLIYNEV